MSIAMHESELLARVHLHSLQRPAPAYTRPNHTSLCARLHSQLHEQVRACNTGLVEAFASTSQHKRDLLLMLTCTLCRQTELTEVRAERAERVEAGRLAEPTMLVPGPAHLVEAVSHDRRADREQRETAGTSVGDAARKADRGVPARRWPVLYCWHIIDRLRASAQTHCSDLGLAKTSLPSLCCPRLGSKAA